MKRSLLVKFLVIAVLVLLILIPLQMIRGTIAERQAFRQQAVASVAESYAEAQTIVGPVIVVPYRVDVAVMHADANGVQQTQLRTEQRQWIYFPAQLRLDGNMTTGVRKRGLHEVRVYELTGKASGTFAFALPTATPEGALRDIGTPFVSVGIDDVRGLLTAPKLLVDGKPLALQQGAGPERCACGVHADLPPIAAGASRTFAVSFDFVLGGTERLGIIPVGDDNRIALASDWPHPQFAGRFLPRSSAISGQGFHAAWDIPSLATNAQSQFVSESNLGAMADRVELTLIDPVNVYLQVDRASKYGLLFVLLTFVGFFLFETIKQLRIHPIQYLLVGLALAIFFLLLLGLSEHYAFVWSYLAASTACIGLQGFYLSFVLHSRARGIGFAAMLTVLYAALYGLLVSEDNALVLGSLMLFAILAAIMVITRRIDWYGVAQLPVADAGAEA